MKLPIIIIAMMIAFASCLQRSSYAVSPKQARLDSLFLKAYYNNDTTAMRKLLRQGANLYKEDRHGYSLLHWAFLRDSNIFKFFLREDANVTRPNAKGISLLHIIAGSEQDYHSAPYTATPELITKLLVSKNDVNAISKSRQTPLHSAASNGKFELVRQLVEHGANVNARDTMGATPLHSASRNRSKRIPKGWVTCGTGWEQHERERIQTLEGRKAIVRYLIEHGADVNAIDHRQNLPLHWCHDCCDEFVKYALPRGMRLDVLNDENETVLHVCAEGSEDGSSVAALIAAGMDINARGRLGQTPLHYTLRRNRIETVKILLAAGADFTIKDEISRTVYQEATQDWQRPEIAKLIRLANGDPDIEAEIVPPDPLKNEATSRPKSEIDQVMEEINRLRK